MCRYFERESVEDGLGEPRDASLCAHTHTHTHKMGSDALTKSLPSPANRTPPCRDGPNTCCFQVFALLMYWFCPSISFFHYSVTNFFGLPNVLYECPHRGPLPGPKESDTPLMDHLVMREFVSRLPRCRLVIRGLLKYSVGSACNKWRGFNHGAAARHPLSDAFLSYFFFFFLSSLSSLSALAQLDFRAKIVFLGCLARAQRAILAIFHCLKVELSSTRFSTNIICSMILFEYRVTVEPAQLDFRKIYSS